MAMKRYEMVLTGLTPLLMHKDNITFSERVKAWQKDPANRELSTAGDDRSPAWTWIGYSYNDSAYFTMDADNLATCFREGGAKVPTGNTRGDKSYKRLTQSGIVFDTAEYDLFVNGRQIPFEPVRELLNANVQDYARHAALAEELGFELFAKRVKIQNSKHIRVRPLFRNWVVKGTITVLDEEMFQLQQPVLQKILDQAGAFVGLCDWRPSSPKSPGFYGKFSAALTPIAL